MRPIRTIAMFPTSLTLGNLVCGFFAIVVASRIGAVTNENLLSDLTKIDPTDAMESALLIFLAMVFDGLDGYVARLSRTASDFGAQLDSLSDLVTFGVAPAFLLVKICPRFALSHHEAVWVIAASYVACAALRLARFNVETSDEDEHLHFSGLPSPAAAAAVAGFAIMFYTLLKEENPLPFAGQIYRALQAVLPFFAVIVALLMVSRIPYPHVVNQIFRGQRTFAHLVAVVFILVAVMVLWRYSIPIIVCGFVFYGPVRLCWQKVVQRRQQEDSLF